MRRGDFIILLLGAAVSPAGALRAQSASTQRVFRWIAYLGTPSPGPRAPYLVALRQGLSETGYVLGENVSIEYRWAEDRYDRLPALATQLVGGKVDVIVVGSSVALLAAKGATSTPVRLPPGRARLSIRPAATRSPPLKETIGIVSIMGPELEPKRLDLLSKLAPQARVIALLANPNNKGAETAIRDAERIITGRIGFDLGKLDAEWIIVNLRFFVITGFVNERTVWPQCRRVSNEPDDGHTPFLLPIEIGSCDRFRAIDW
jgi:putative ABC transport system substrate-binding protein